MGELVLFQTYRRKMYRRPSKRLRNWFERVTGIGDISMGPAEIIILPVIRIERQEGASGRTGGYPRESPQLKAAFRKVDEAVARTQKHRQTVTFEPLSVKLRRKKPPSEGEYVKLDFPFRLRAALRPPCRIMAPSTFLPSMTFGAI